MCKKNIQNLPSSKTEIVFDDPSLVQAQAHLSEQQSSLNILV